MLKVLFAGLMSLQVVSSPQQVTLKDLRLVYPSGLSQNQASDRALVLTSFRGKYGHGGIIPRNGMEVTILVDEKKGKTVDQIIAEDGEGDRLLQRSALQIGGQTAIKLRYELDFVGFKLAETRVYFDRGEAVYKIFLSIYPDDSNRGTSEQLFERLLRSVKFR